MRCLLNMKLRHDLNFALTIFAISLGLLALALNSKSADFSECDKIAAQINSETNLETKITLGVKLLQCASSVASKISSVRSGDIIISKLHWECSTNWSPGGESSTLMWPPSANTITHHESGSVVSNLIAVVEWKGKYHGVVVETIPLQTLSRSYTMEERKVYR